MKSTTRLDRYSLAGWLTVLLAVACVSLVRARLILAGPDIDTDAFDHAFIARRMLNEWRDVSIHWVWLPLWHALVALVTLAGGSLDAVRWINVGLSALSPLCLTALLAPCSERPIGPSGRSLPFIAGATLALWPLGLGVGEFAQPEALFEVLMLSTCLAWERRWNLTTAALCSGACLLRYEAWVLPVALLVVHLCERRGASGLVAIGLPCLSIGLWCAVHADASGEWLRFLRQNQDYTRGAWRDLGLDTSTELRVRHPWLWYPLLLPWQSVGPFIALCPLGARWIAKRAPRSLALSSCFILAFVTLVWARRMNLGLPRHFVVLIPLYATAFAAGVCAITDQVTRGFTSLNLHARGIALALGALALIHVCATRGRGEALALSHAHGASLREERQVVPWLRASLEPGQRVFSDMPRVEVISGLAPERFIHWEVTRVGNFNMAVEATRRGAAFALSSPGRTRQLKRSQKVFANNSVALVRRDRPAVIDRILQNAPPIP